jgi:hypothetical protein
LGPAVDAEASSSHYYNRWHTKIIFSPGGNWFEGGYSPIAGADVSSFAPLNRSYGIDRKALFYQERLLVGEQPNGFRVVSGPYAAGKGHVYWWERLLSRQIPHRSPASSSRSRDNRIMALTIATSFVGRHLREPLAFRTAVGTVFRRQLADLHHDRFMRITERRSCNVSHFIETRWVLIDLRQGLN